MQNASCGGKLVHTSYYILGKSLKVDGETKPSTLTKPLKDKNS